MKRYFVTALLAGSLTAASIMAQAVLAQPGLTSTGLDMHHHHGMPCPSACVPDVPAPRPLTEYSSSCREVCLPDVSIGFSWNLGQWRHGWLPAPMGHFRKVNLLLKRSATAICVPAVPVPDFKHTEADENSPAEPLPQGTPETTVTPETRIPELVEPPPTAEPESLKPTNTPEPVPVLDATDELDP